MPRVRARLGYRIDGTTRGLSDIGAKTARGDLKLADGITAVHVTVIGAAATRPTVIVVIIVGAVHGVVVVEIVDAMETDATRGAVRIDSRRQQRELLPAPRTHREISNHILGDVLRGLGPLGLEQGHFGGYRDQRLLRGHRHFEVDS